MKKEESYIKTVVSHIGDDVRKAEVLAELGDHLQEKTVYFEDIGYEKEPAAEKAEQALGDLAQAELVGEQLNEIKRNRRLPRILLTVAALLLLFVSTALFYMNNGGLEFDIPVVPSRVYMLDVPRNFITFLMIELCWCACLWLLLLCVRYRAVAGMFLLLPSVGTLSGIGTVYFISIFKALLAFENIGVLFYYPDFGGYVVGETESYFCWFVLAGVIGTAALICAILALKKKRLTFGKRDFKLQRILRTGLLCAAIASTVYLVAVSAVTIPQQQAVKARAARTLAAMDTFVLEHTDEILAEDKSAARAQLQALLGEDVSAKDLNCQANGIRFYTYTDKGKTYFRLFRELQGLKGEWMKLSDEATFEQAKNCDMTDPYNLPKPYALAISQSSYGKGEKGLVVDVFYSDLSEYADEIEMELSDKVQYRHTANGQWKYMNSMFRMRGQVYDYDDVHAELLRSALKNNLCDPHPYPYDEYMDCHCDLYQKIYAISFDDTLGQYQADLLVETEYWAWIDGKLYTLENAYDRTISVTYKIENGKAVILELWQPEDGELYKSSVYSRFSVEGYAALEADYEPDLYSIYAAHNRRIAKKCGAKVYGYISGIDDAGDCSYFTLNVLYEPAEEKTMHLEKKK